MGPQCVRYDKVWRPRDHYINRYDYIQVTTMFEGHQHPRNLIVQGTPTLEWTQRTRDPKFPGNPIKGTLISKEPQCLSLFFRVPHSWILCVCLSLFHIFSGARTLLPVHNFLRFWPTWLPFWRWKSMDFGECNKLWKLGLGHNATM